MFAVAFAFAMHVTRIFFSGIVHLKKNVFIRNRLMNVPYFVLYIQYVRYVVLKCFIFSRDYAVTVETIFAPNVVHTKCHDPCLELHVSLLGFSVLLLCLHCMAHVRMDVCWCLHE